MEYELTKQGQALVWRLVAEFTVIVLGVLVALAADRWSQSRDEDELSREYAARLVTELEADSARLEQHRAAARSRSRDGVALVEAIRGTAPDSTIMRLYFSCAGTALPHRGGATYEELRSTGLLRLMSEDVRAALFEHYGFVEGLLGRLDRVRREDRSQLATALNQSGAFMPRDVISSAEFTSRLRAVRNIDGIAMGCVAFQTAEDVLVRPWVSRTGQLAELIRRRELAGAAP